MSAFDILYGRRDQPPNLNVSRILQRGEENCTRRMAESILDDVLSDMFLSTQTSQIQQFLSTNPYGTWGTPSQSTSQSSQSICQAINQAIDEILPEANRTLYSSHVSYRDDYSLTLPDYFADQPFGQMNLVGQVQSEIDKARAIAGNYNNPQEHYKFQFGIETAFAEQPGETKIIMCKSSSNFEIAAAHAITMAKKICSEYYEKYKKSLKFTVWSYNDVVGQGGGKVNSFDSKFTIVSSNTKTNCLYHAATICRRPTKIEEYAKNPAKLENAARLLKRACSDKGTESSTKEIDKLAHHIKTDIILHNHCGEVLHEAKYNKTVKRFRKDLTKENEPIHIKLVDGHYVTLRPKTDLNDLNENDEKPEAVANQNIHIARPTDDGPIRVFQKKNIKFNDNFAAWDIEATNDSQGIQTPYDCGTQSKFGYEAFPGLDCIPKFFEYLYKNIEKFDGYTMYAHNSGKYDTIHLIQSYLLDNTDKFKIDPKRSCCSNGRWLRLTLKTNDGKSLKFQDSYAIISMPLKKACIEFDVEHQKLDKTVNHDDITLENWHTFEELPKYLENDCKGLYEVIDQYTKDIWEVSKHKINITDCLTSATFAKHNYLENYYDQKNGESTRNLKNMTNMFVNPILAEGVKFLWFLVRL